MVGALQQGNTGAAYVFRNSGGTWSQQAKLSDGASKDGFGTSVAMSGSTVVVGAPDADSFTGAAYIFVNSGGTWSQQAELTASDGAPDDFFGAVAISGSTVVVGAQDHDSMGAAYVFVNSGGTWSQQAKLTASDGASGDSFGISVAMYHSTAVIGAPGHASIGAAYVFVNV